MKVNYLHGALAVSLMMLSACSNDDNFLSKEGLDNAGKQEFVLQVSNLSDGAVESRAGRPLYSSEANQSIENVTVVICGSDNKVAYVKTIPNWNTTSSVYSEGGHGRQTTFQIPEDKALKTGTYTVYAYGYHGTESNKSDYTLTGITGITEGSTFTGSPVINIKDGVRGEEIFGGAKLIEVKENIGFKHSIILNRQVAGTFGYFEAIPYETGATKLRLVASQLNTSVVLGGFANQMLTANGITNLGSTPKYTVNGTDKSAAETVVYEINLKEWFGDELTNDNGLIGGRWNKPAKYANAKFKTGSVFGGTFIIPFESVTGQKTFVLQLTDDSGKVLRNWSINHHEEEGGAVHTPYTLAYWNGSAFSSKDNVKDEKDIYNVVRNHLYGIGKRVSDNPENPGNDPEDKPESLNKKEQLTLRVNDNWEVIHNMDVEEFEVPSIK